MRFHLDQRYVIAASCALALALSVVLAVAAYEIVGDPLAELSQSHDERAEHVAEIEVLGTSETVDAALGIKNETSNVIAQQNNGVAPATTAVTAPDEADDNPDTTSAGNIDDASGAAPLAFVASTAEIGGRVWIDRNGNGIQDSQEESDPSGVIVRLLDENRFFEDITTTDGAGEYSFVVEPGKYILFFDIEQESISPRFATFDKSLDSDVSPATFFQEPGDPVGILGGLSDSVGVLAGDVVTTKDAGVIPIFTSVAIETSTNNADSDTAPGEELEVNETVTFTYTVTNTGNVRLIDIAVADDVIGPIECLTNTLGVGQSLTCTATTKVTEGPYVNLGSVSATPIDSVDIALRPVGARDISHHVGVVPFMASASVSLETATNGEDDASPGPQCSATTMESSNGIVASPPLPARKSRLLPANREPHRDSQTNSSMSLLAANSSVQPRASTRPPRSPSQPVARSSSCTTACSTAIRSAPIRSSSHCAERT